MPKIVPLVEGPGDVDAVPGLLYSILHQRQQVWDWQVALPKKVRGLGALKKRLERLMIYSARDADGGGILILLDLDDGCPKEEALNLSEQIRSLQLVCPVAIVFAHREYEAWFLASLSTVVGNIEFLSSDLRFDGEIEEIRGAKGWFTRKMPAGRAYKETIHQKQFTSLLDIDLAYQHSRSFRRLCKSVEELVDLASNAERGQVTP